MSEEAAEAKPAKPSAPKGPMILALVNTLGILAVGGVFYYTRVLFKRPTITEEAERKRIAEAKAAQPTAYAPVLVEFEPIVVNIKNPTVGPQDVPPRGANESHYAKMAVTIELRNPTFKPSLEAIQPLVIDKMISLLGKKEYSELATVQGRYVLRTQIIDMGNELLRTATRPDEKVVTNVFFTSFEVN